MRAKCQTHVILHLLWVGFPFIAAVCQGGGIAVPASGDKSFAAQNWFCWHRAVQDSIAEAQGDAAGLAASARLACTPAPFNGGPTTLLDFHDQDGRLVPWLIEEVKRAPNAASMDGVVLCLGRMGPEAKAAIPVLQRRLEQTELTELRKIPLRVALANLGFRPAELLAHITVDLDATNCIPTESVQAITLRAMAFSGAKDWVKDDLARHVARLLNAKGDIPFLAILALGAAGTNASVAKDTLARWEAKAPGTIDGGGWQRCLGFARYRVDPAHPSEALRGSLARHGSKNLDHTDGVLLMWMSYVFVDEDLLAQLVAALGDRDDQVRLGVMRFLLFVGRPAAKAAPRLFELTRQSRDEQVRLSAFAALGAIAEQGNVAELEACLRKESEERVQAAIQNAIHLLKHEPVSVSP